MNGVKIIFNKEMRRVFKDTKMIFSLFILPVILMVGIYGLIGYLGSRMMQDVEEHTSVVAIQNAPADFGDSLREFAANAQITYLDGQDSVDQVKTDIYNGEADLLVVFPVDFTAQLGAYGTGAPLPEVKTYYNPSEDYSATARENMVNALTTVYEKKLLAERFGDISVITAFTIDADNPDSIIQNDQKAGGKFLSMMLPYLITILLFAGAMSLGVDTITGEKERGTMSCMLVTPVSRMSIALGKLLALVVLSLLSGSVYVIVLSLSLPTAMQSMAENGGLSIAFSAGQIVMLAALILSLAFLYVTLIGITAVFAKTMKEASTYVMPVYMIVIVAGIFTMMSPNTARAGVEYLIPVYNCSVALGEIFTQELTTVHFLMTLGSTIVYGLLLTAGIARTFNNEKVMFNA